MHIKFNTEKPGYNELQGTEPICSLSPILAISEVLYRPIHFDGTETHVRYNRVLLYNKTTQDKGSFFLCLAHRTRLCACPSVERNQIHLLWKAGMWLTNQEVCGIFFSICLGFESHGKATQLIHVCLSSNSEMALAKAKEGPFYTNS